jgi:hypothetical protein
MCKLFSWSGPFTGLWKRASAKSTLDAVPLALPDDCIPDNPTSDEKPTGAADGPNNNTLTNMSASHHEATATLETLPAEVQWRILAHLADDLVSLRALAEASPVFYQQYLLDRRTLLRTGLKAALGNSLLDAYAVQMSASLHDPSGRQGTTPPPEAVRMFLDEYATMRPATPDLVLDEFCTEEDLLHMASFYRTLARPLAGQCAARFLHRLDPCLEVGKMSTTTESSRLLGALYRYQLYCGLFGPGPGGYMRREDPDVGSKENVDLFFSLFRPWEVEDIWCISVIVRDVYLV